MFDLTGLPTLSGRSAHNLSDCEAADRVETQQTQNLPVRTVKCSLEKYCIEKTVFLLFETKSKKLYDTRRIYKLLK